MPGGFGLDGLGRFRGLRSYRYTWQKRFGGMVPFGLGL